MRRLSGHDGWDGRGGRSGLTLIEVIAALAILGTLLVAVIVAKGRFARQWHDTNQKLIAIHAADQLLEQWWDPSPPLPQGKPATAKPSPDQSARLPFIVPVPATGVLPNGMRWRTQSLDSPRLADLHARRVRLEILSSDTGSNQALISVDVVAPVPDKQKRKGRTHG